jgi:hypothetical protein
MTDRRGTLTMLAAAALAALLVGLALQDTPAARGADDPALRARLAAALGPDATPPASAAVKATRATAPLRRAAKRLAARHRRDGADLVAALAQPGAAGSRALVQAASRLRADALDLAARIRRAKARGKSAKRARTVMLATQAAAVTALDAIRRFGQSTHATAASAHLRAAEAALATTQARATAARRLLGCRKPCGSGF